MESEYAPIQLFCSPTMARKDNTKPMCSYFDISFLDPAALLVRPLHALVFENHYVSSLSCAQQVSDGTEFVVLDRKLLMPSISSAEGAQQTFHVQTAEFNSRYQPGLPIRVYLFQPSPHWTSFDLRDVKAYSLIPRDPDVCDVSSAAGPLSADMRLLREASAARRTAHAVVFPSSGSHTRGKLKKSKVDKN